VDVFTPTQRPGTPAADAPVAGLQGATGWLLRELQGGFAAFCFDDEVAANLSLLERGRIPVAIKRIGRGALADPSGKAAERYDATPGTTYLIRPDQHVAARWRRPDGNQIAVALDRALALQE
ncbi:MAG TPA: FAD-dependent oxidoreductase, partial [Stellaceae bacterium]|nr:FAD-dependent oxidoreductase [Stellaceae bacterium]